jgi:hypothetical protein
VPDMACSGCHQIYTDDPSGLCEDCQTDVVSQRPGSVTDDQRGAICAEMEALGLEWRFTAGREAVLEAALQGWGYGGDLNSLSQQQAGDVLEHLEARRHAH